MGTPEFAVPALQALLDNNEQVVAVVSQPDRPKGRGRKLIPTPVKVVAQAAGIQVLQPTKIKTQEYLDELRSYEPDIFLVAAYGRILTQKILDLPRYGCLNVHGSLLPKYRGAAPVQWSILNGEALTGITIMQMDEGLDTGDILLQGSLPIEDDDTSQTLAPKLAALGGKLLVETLNRLRAGELNPEKQDDDKATFARMLAKEDAIIDWSNPARHISCQIRGLDPWPTAVTFLNGKRLRLYKPKVLDQGTTDIKPGTVTQADKNGLLIACGEDSLLIQEIQKDGSKRMPVHAFLQGNQIDAGTILGQAEG